MRAFWIVLAFLAGMGGGILSQNLPFYIPSFPRSDSGFLELRQVIVRDNEQIIKMVSKVRDAVLEAKTKTSSGMILEGSGFILTSDGLFVTLADLVPRGSEFSFKSQEKALSFQILKRDPQNNLALVKLEASGLPTSGFDSGLKLGEEIFILGQVNGQKRVNQGIVSAMDKDIILTNIFEDDIMAGSAAFNTEGKMVGLVLVEKGRVKIIPLSILRQFSGL